MYCRHWTVVSCSLTDRPACATDVNRHMLMILIAERFGRGDLRRLSTRLPCSAARSCPTLRTSCGGGGGGNDCKSCAPAPSACILADPATAVSISSADGPAPCLMPRRARGADPPTLGGVKQSTRADLPNHAACLARRAYEHGCSSQSVRMQAGPRCRSVRRLPSRPHSSMRTAHGEHPPWARIWHRGGDLLL